MPPQSSPLLDQYNQDGIVTPALRRALDIARQKLPQWQLPAPSSTESTAPRLMPPGAPVPSITRSAPATTPAPTTPTPQLTPPDQDIRDLTELNRLKNTGSGISQIQNPVGRGLLRAADVIGSAFAPRITAGIPGTELHHNYLVKQAEGAVDKDVARAKEGATTAETEQRTTNENLAAPGQRAHTEAETRNVNAEAANREHPPAKEPANLLEWYRKAYPDKTPEDYAKFEQENKSATEKGGTIHTAEDGTLIVAHPDGTATRVMLDGQPVKAKITEKEPNQYADFKTDYLKKHPNADAAEIQREFKKVQEKPEDHGVTGFAGGKVVRLQPGQEQPKDFTTTTQAGSLNIPTAQTKTMAEAAPKVLDFVDRIGKMIDQQSASLGPAASRWSEFMAGKVGAPNPDFTKLRTDVGLLQTALMRMHVGARGGEAMMEHFRDLIDVSKQSPENLKAALEEIRDYANAVKASGSAKGEEEKVGQIPTVKTKAEYDKLPKGAEYMEDGKKYRKP